MPALGGVRHSLSIAVLSLLFVVLLAGCGSSSNTSSNQPQPQPGTPPTGTPPPSGGGSGSAGGATFVYARTSSGQLAGFRLNSDGTLTALSGSPFTVPGNLVAGSSGHLFTSTGTQLLVYGIDPSSGALTAQGQASVASAGPIAASNGFVYVSGAGNSNNWVVYSFAVSGNGTLTPVGSPVTVAGSCELCVTPGNMTVDAKYVVVGLGGGEHGAGGIAVLARQADGSVTMSGSNGADTIASTSLDSADRAVYGVDVAVGYILVSATNGQQLQSLFPQSGTFNGVTADRSGKFVVTTLTPNAVTTYSLNPAGTIGGQVSTTAAAGTTFVPVLDKSGTLLVVQESSGLETFKFDPASGAVTHVQTTAVAGPGVPVILTP